MHNDENDENYLWGNRGPQERSSGFLQSGVLMSTLNCEKVSLLRQALLVQNPSCIFGQLVFFGTPFSPQLDLNQNWGAGNISLWGLKSNH